MGRRFTALHALFVPKISFSNDTIQMCISVCVEEHECTDGCPSSRWHAVCYPIDSFGVLKICRCRRVKL